MKFGTISFNDLLNNNHQKQIGDIPAFTDDVDSCVLIGLEFGDSINKPDMVEEILLDDFKDCGFVTADVHITHILRITGNVKGDEGRKDWLVVFDKDAEYNCLKRFLTNWRVGWVCDFVVNYREDYDPDYNPYDNTDYDI